MPRSTSDEPDTIDFDHPAGIGDRVETEADDRPGPTRHRREIELMIAELAVGVHIEKQRCFFDVDRVQLVPKNTRPRCVPPPDTLT
jgi:hypothetical protein